VQSSTKAGVAAALAKLNEAQAGTKRVQNFELKEEKAVYDVVDEDEYAQLVTKRRIEAGRCWPGRLKPLAPIAGQVVLSRQYILAVMTLSKERLQP